MNTKTKILDFVRRKRAVRTAEVVRFARISRQAAAKHLRELVAARKLSKEGSTRNARYVPFSPQKAAALKERPAAFIYGLRRLEEDRVFAQVSSKLALKRSLSPAAYRIIQYAFTEMLNNAVDHSKSARARIELRQEHGSLTFRVLDRGIGVFESIRRKFKLRDHFEAAEQLLKGKQTTAPEHHSGQGIFFTSRIADRFSLESAALRLEVDNQLKDVGLMDIKPVRGTLVTFVLKQRSRKDLKTVFDAYSDSNFRFDKTEIRIRLSRASGSYVSRSEARRLLFGLEKFKRIVLDFSEVNGIGQGFADEIFRIFRREHPEILIQPEQMSPSVEFFVKRAIPVGLQSKK